MQGYNDSVAGSALYGAGVISVEWTKDLGIGVGGERIVNGCVVASVHSCNKTLI